MCSAWLHLSRNGKRKDRLCGTSPDGSLVEVIELVNHPWFVGCQFHPEFKSRPDQAHPLFLGFVKAAIESSR